MYEDSVRGSNLLVDDHGLTLIAQIAGVQAHNSCFFIPVLEFNPSANRARSNLAARCNGGPVLAKAMQLLQKATALAVKHAVIDS